MNKKGILLVLCTAIISGFSIFINKFGVQGIESSVFAGAKNLVVAIFLFSIILLANDFKKLQSLTKKDFGKLALIGLLGGSIPFLLFFKGLQITSSSQGSFIHKTMFIWVGFLALIFLKEKLNKGMIIGAVLLLVGNFLLLKITNFVFTTGDLLILAATIFWSFETIISKKALKQMDAKIVGFGRMFFGSLIIMIFLALTNKISLIAALSGSQWLWVAVTSVFLYGYVITWYSGLKHVKASLATSMLLLGSVITTMLNIIFSNAVITQIQAAGVLLLISGVACIFWFSERFKKAQETFSIA